MNQELLYNLQLQAGGSLYPTINPQMQQKFAELIIRECYSAIDRSIQSMENPSERFGAEIAADAISKKFKIT